VGGRRRVGSRKWGRFLSATTSVSSFALRASMSSANSVLSSRHCSSPPTTRYQFLYVDYGGEVAAGSEFAGQVAEEVQEELSGTVPS
jgi:hypothetical protein